MIVPSIDLMNGHAVQLEQGKKLKIDAGDPWPIAEKFGRIGDIAVIDLDAALGKGDNKKLIAELSSKYRCRVGGGLRSVDAAIEMLDAGAQKIILGTAAKPEILSQLPKDRVLAALDAVHDEVVVDGWRTKTGTSIKERMAELAPYVSGFLVTFVENEGMLTGLDMQRAKSLREAAGDLHLTVAGGVKSSEEVAELDRLGIDAQIGMALYTGQFDIGDAIAAMAVSDRDDGLIPTIVTDDYNRALGLVYSSGESINVALAEGRGVYWSRRRGLWRKGETSGAVQKLLRVELDCDRDVLKFVVEQTGRGFCHLDTLSCFGELDGLPSLYNKLIDPETRAAPGSYTARLFNDPTLLAAKIREEANELIEANSHADIAAEMADLFYFVLVKAAASGVSLRDVEQVLRKRSLRVKRRKGDAKPGAIEAELARQNIPKDDSE